MARPISAPLRVLDGGFASFRGLELSGGKKITSAVKAVTSGRTNVIITFADGNVYKFSCIKNGDNISDVREYWNDEPIYEEVQP
jgi:predicted HAD superfamily phosphohydrolase